MSVVAEVIASNYLTQRFEVHCVYTRYSGEDKDRPDDLTFTSQAFVAPFCQHNAFQVEIEEEEFWDHKIAVRLKISDNKKLVNSKFVHKVYIVKCDGSKIDVSSRAYPIDEEVAEEYLRNGNEVYLRLEIDIICSDHSRERFGLLKLYDSIDNGPSDFEIRARNGSLKVTKNLLMIKWEYFNALTNAKGDEKLNNIWAVEDFDVKIMKDIVGFVYCDAISFKGTEHAMKLAEAGHRYGLKDLLDDCSKYLSGDLRVENVLSMLQLSDMYDLSALKEKCLIMLPKALKEHDMEDMLGYDEFRKYDNRAELIVTCLQKSVRI
ncbi:Protein maternal effect lethal 26 [Halotydeus destructor]|nr:Protein maternal effect lethal 26 [Halotydeus destructor]